MIRRVFPFRSKKYWSGYATASHTPSDSRGQAVITVVFTCPPEFADELVKRMWDAVNRAVTPYGATFRDVASHLVN